MYEDTYSDATGDVFKGEDKSFKGHIAGAYPIPTGEGEDFDHIESDPIGENDSVEPIDVHRTIDEFLEAGPPQKPPELAFWVSVGGDRSMFVHARSRGRAKQIYLEKTPIADRPPFIDLSAWRLKAMDGNPFADKLLMQVTADKLNKDHFNKDYQWDNHYLRFCPCAVCAAARKELGVAPW